LCGEDDKLGAAIFRGTHPAVIVKHRPVGKALRRAMTQSFFLRLTQLISVPVAFVLHEQHGHVVHELKAERPGEGRGRKIGPGSDVAADAWVLALRIHGPVGGDQLSGRERSSSVERSG
jgi:methylglyoxal synthase